MGCLIFGFLITTYNTVLAIMVNTMSSAIIGEQNLLTLLSTLTTVLHEPSYVFATFPNIPNDPALLSECRMLFREDEGITLILPLEVAEERNIDYTFESRMITCNIHSSLEAVGFLAAITAWLKAAGIPCNPVSAYYHDHLFVPVGRENAAMKVLSELAENACGAHEYA